MKAVDLKEYIITNNLVQNILEEINCHSIEYKSGNPDNYYSCGNYDGDNPHAITVYLNDNLTVVNYTRQMNSNPNLSSDIITLVQHNEQLSFFEAIKFLCNFMEIDFYKDFSSNLPKSLIITRMINRMNNPEDDEDYLHIKKIPEKILSYYYPHVNDLFKNDGIGYITQQEFEIGYDPYSNRITIPIRDEIGNLVGVKGRLFKEKLLDHEMKYIYIEPCSKGKILYGLHKTINYIVEKGVVFVGEAEKFVCQLWEMEYKNCVSTGGTKIGRLQVEKLTRLGVEIIFCFDKDIELSTMKYISDKFIDGVSVSCMIDEDGILDEKESPSDSKKKFEHLLKNNIIKLKGRKNEI